MQTDSDWGSLARQIKLWALEEGFSAVGITDTELQEAERHLLDWLAKGYHGDMDYMAKHGARRSRPQVLHSGTLSVISVRMNYLPSAARSSLEVLDDKDKAFISRYALGRDYHKTMRGRLQNLADRISKAVGEFNYRVFTDSAPVMEVALAQKAGLGWRGKHTLLLSKEGGSWFFLGEIYTDLPLPRDEPKTDHCGTCQSCIEACPTGAIVAPYRLDARRCISYLTIEHKGAIPMEYRPLIGNRVYGCDDCQLACPWSRFAKTTDADDFAAVRHGLDDASLVTLFRWTREEFAAKLSGSAIHRIGHEQWLRNLAVGLGNAPASKVVRQALKERENDPSPLVREHVHWALSRHAAVIH